jgi:hypothetical protein
LSIASPHLTRIPSNADIRAVANGHGKNFGLIVREPGKEEAALFCKFSQGRTEISTGKPMFGGDGQLLGDSMKNPTVVKRDQVKGLDEKFKDYNVTANIWDGSPNWRDE